MTDATPFVTTNSEKLNGGEFFLEKTHEPPPEKMSFGPQKPTSNGCPG